MSELEELKIQLIELRAQKRALARHSKGRRLGWKRSWGDFHSDVNEKELGKEIAELKKRIKNYELIYLLEEARNGFQAAHMKFKDIGEQAGVASMKAHHALVDKGIKKLGGESCPIDYGEPVERELIE